MRKTLVLEEDDLVMVVGQEVVHRLDKHRGELTRTEFVNLLIHNQIERSEHPQNYVDREEFYRIVHEVKGLLGSFLELIFSLGLIENSEDDSFTDWLRKVKLMGTSDNGGA